MIPDEFFIEQGWEQKVDDSPFSGPIPYFRKEGYRLIHHGQYKPHTTYVTVEDPVRVGLFDPDSGKVILRRTSLFRGNLHTEEDYHTLMRLLDIWV